MKQLPIALLLLAFICTGCQAPTASVADAAPIPYREITMDIEDTFLTKETCQCGGKLITWIDRVPSKYDYGLRYQCPHEPLHADQISHLSVFEQTKRAECTRCDAKSTEELPTEALWYCVKYPFQTPANTYVFIPEWPEDIPEAYPYLPDLNDTNYFEPMPEV